MLKLISFNLFLLSVIFSVYSQNSCNSSYTKKGRAFGSPFGVSSQSKSTTMQPGQKALYNIVVYKDFEYRISLCTNKGIVGLHFLILTNPQNKVLFDSSNLDVNKQEAFLEINQTSNLIIEVVFPQQSLKMKRKNKRKDACIGVLIEYYSKDKL